MNNEYILCAAIWYKFDEEFSHQPKNVDSGLVIAGWRHHSVIGTAAGLDIITSKTPHVQGFLTNQNRFVDRNEASTIAFNAGQIKKDIGTLTSEELY